MGEKLLAQRLLLLLHEFNGRTSYTAQTVLDWAQQSRAQLLPAAAPAEGEDEQALTWDDVPDLARRIDTGGEPAGPLDATLEAVADLLMLGAFDRALITAALALQRSRLLASLTARLACGDTDMLTLVGMLAGAEVDRAAAAVQRSAAVSLGLLAVEESRGAVEASWRFARLLDQGLADPERLIEGLVGVRQQARLAPDAFDAAAVPFDLLRRLLCGALGERAAGINILLHGPPGTGKTELARSLAAAAGASLLAVGESDSDGEEPNRWERLHALKRAQRMLAGRSDSLLLFDEMEDLFADDCSFPANRAGSKLFVNRQIESNPVPVIATTSAASIRRTCGG